MSAEFMLGFGVAFIGILVIRFLYARSHERAGQYDERQMAIRGIGYRNGMATLVLSQVACIFIKGGTTLFDRFAWDLILFVTLMSGIVVFIVYSIFHDSFFGMIKNEKTYIALCVFVVVVNAIAIKPEVFRSDALLTFYNSANLICVIVFLIVIGSLVIRHFQIKRDEE